MLFVCDLKLCFLGDLKDMRKLSSKDEAFHLSWETIRDIIDIIRSLKTPTPKTYSHWDEYARSFYLKMCTCHGVDYHNLEDGNKPTTINIKEQVILHIN